MIPINPSKRALDRTRHRQYVKSKKQILSSNFASTIHVPSFRAGFGMGWKAAIVAMRRRNTVVPKEDIA